MIVLIDGKEVECNNDVKVIWDDHPVSLTESERAGQVHLTVTNEGVIADIFEEGGNESYATAALEPQDIYDMAEYGWVAPENLNP